ncbi:MAG: hypothetical protein LC804_03260 [Acidobacteria bacterium]|nr:hypothetical protein [Acidobacteriota bacterium]
MGLAAVTQPDVDRAIAEGDFRDFSRVDLAKEFGKSDGRGRTRPSQQVQPGGSGRQHQSGDDKNQNTRAAKAW